MPSASVSKRVSYENEFDLHENKLVGETHCHKNGLARKIVLTLEAEGPWKWSILSKTWKK